MTTPRYRHTPTARGEPCPYAAWKGAQRQCSAWKAHECRKRCEGLQAWDRRDAARHARLVGPRIFPMPKGGGREVHGNCNWCGDPILHHKGKSVGQVNSRRGWHDGRETEPDCLWALYLHTRLENQREFVIDRDGPRCWDCGVEPFGWKRDAYVTTVYVGSRLWPRGEPLPRYVGVQWVSTLELDHETPLWSVAHLPDDERSAYFGPVNLRMRCPPCHAAKTRREARERAAVKAAAPRCGTCVVWNGLEGAVSGGCSVHGDRRATGAPCDRWFAKDQLHAALYGRAKAAP